MDNNILNKRTPGEWDFGYGDSSNSFGIFTKKMLDEGLSESPICLISPIEKMNEVDKANAAFICKAVNNYDSLLEALKEITKWGKLKDGKFTFTTSEAQLNELKEAIKKAEQ